MVARLLWECRGGIRDRVRRMPQSLATPAFAGFPPVVENGIKAALTTGMTTDRIIFDFLPRRGIMTEIEYPGVAKLVSRLIWVCRGGIRDRARRNAAKPCGACVYRIFSDCRKRHKSGFDHINDHRQKNLYFYPSPWYHGRKVNIRVWLNW